LKVLDIYDLGTDHSNSDSDEYNYSQHSDISDGLLSENGDTDLSTTTLRTSEQSVAQDTKERQLMFPHKYIIFYYLLVEILGIPVNLHHLA